MFVSVFSLTIAVFEIVLFTFEVTFTLNVILASPALFDLAGTVNATPAFKLSSVIVPSPVALISPYITVPTGIESEIFTVPSL